MRYVTMAIPDRRRQLIDSSNILAWIQAEAFGEYARDILTPLGKRRGVMPLDLVKPTPQFIDWKFIECRNESGD
jgi:hypothetical protein